MGAGTVFLSRGRPEPRHGAIVCRADRHVQRDEILERKNFLGSLQKACIPYLNVYITRRQADKRLVSVTP